jgi:hypothetical protein
MIDRISDPSVYHDSGRERKAIRLDIRYLDTAFRLATPAPAPAWLSALAGLAYSRWLRNMTPLELLQSGNPPDGYG